MQESGLAADRLGIELAESILMDDSPVGRQVLDDLKRLGVQLAIDDFGTGYSSLSYLKRMPVDVLKIDRSFVGDLGRDPRPASIIEARVNVADAPGMSVTAEGIEEREQLSFLTGIGCESGQGFLFSRPVPADEVPDIVQALNRGMLSKAG